MKLYHDILIDHYKNPHNKGRLSTPDFSSLSHNPACGDLVLIEGTIENGIITSLSFEGTGCVISQATASLLTTALITSPCHLINTLSKEFILKLIGIDLGPTRLRCALLSLEATQKGVAESVTRRSCAQ